jgi:hypothetical protein
MDAIARGGVADGAAGTARVPHLELAIARIVPDAIAEDHRCRGAALLLPGPVRAVYRVAGVILRGVETPAQRGGGDQKVVHEQLMADVDGDDGRWRVQIRRRHQFRRDLRQRRWRGRWQVDPGGVRLTFRLPGQQSATAAGRRYRSLVARENNAGPIAASFNPRGSTGPLPLHPLGITFSIDDQHLDSPTDNQRRKRPSTEVVPADRSDNTMCGWMAHATRL